MTTRTPDLPARFVAAAWDVAPAMLCASSLSLSLSLSLPLASSISLLSLGFCEIWVGQTCLVLFAVEGPVEDLRTWRVAVVAWSPGPVLGYRRWCGGATPSI
jgi:hypothetical protein